MKNLPAIAALCALLTPTAFANPRHAFTLGGGVNSSYLDYEDASDAERSNRWGYNVGAGLQFHPVPGFSYVLEANLETRGEKVNVSGSSDKIEMRLEYVQIPVFAMVHVPTGKMTLDLFAGPVVGIPVSGKVKSPRIMVFPGTEDNPPLYIPAGTREIEDLATQFGVEVGVGLDIPWLTHSLFIRPSYYHGFTGKLTDGDTDDLYQRNFKLKGGLKILL